MMAGEAGVKKKKIMIAIFKALEVGALLRNVLLVLKLRNVQRIRMRASKHYQISPLSTAGNLPV
jgi:hypothetical protein